MCISAIIVNKLTIQLKLSLCSLSLFNLTLIFLLQVDICPENILKTTRTALAKLLRAHGKMPFPVKDLVGVQTAADSLCSDRITPVFTLSSVTGQGKRVVCFWSVFVLFNYQHISKCLRLLVCKHPFCLACLLSKHSSFHLGVDLLKAFVATVRRSAARYSGLDADPEVTYERMPHIHFAIDGTSRCFCSVY